MVLCLRPLDCVIVLNASAWICRITLSEALSEVSVNVLEHFC